MKRSGVRINKKFIIIASLVIVLLLGIYYVYYKINLTPIENDIKEITSLKQGTYESFYPSTIPYIILTVENNEYILYENTEKLDSGIIKYKGDNTFEFLGESFSFYLYAVKNDIYVCSFDNKMNYQHFELEYATPVLINYV